MLSGWRRVFCTSVPREPDPDPTAIEDLDGHHNFGHGSGTPSTPSRTTVALSRSAPISPEIDNSPRLFQQSLHTFSPCSPSSFSFLKSSLRIRTRRCGICLESIKKGNGTATFRAECSHAFHYPCISNHVKMHGSLSCPVCSSLWREMPVLTVDDTNPKHQPCEAETSRKKLATSNMDDDVIGVNEYSKPRHKRPELKVYNDDEALAVLTPKARFNPIPESDENCDEDVCVNIGEIEVSMLPEAVMITASGRHQNYGIVLNVKAPTKKAQQPRAPIDLVAVVDVSCKITRENLQVMKKTMRTIVSSLSSSDRLSIVAFSSHSKRLMPLRRMTTTGRRYVHNNVEAMNILDGSSNTNDAVKKALKVLLDRREKNPNASLIVLSNDLDQSHSHSRFNIPIHPLNLVKTDEKVLAKVIGKMLNVAVQDVQMELQFVSLSKPGVITAVYSRTPKPIILGSSTVEIGQMSVNEERELFVEIKLPFSTQRSHQLLSVRCRYTEVSSQEIIYGQQQTFSVLLPNTVRSSSIEIQRMRNIFISTRALANSRRLAENNDVAGACNILVSAQAMMRRANLAAGDEVVLGLEAELRELKLRLGRRDRVGVEPVACMDVNGEPLTPTSAWKVADKLAKVAMMRKSVNRVSDLHGFEDARF